MRYTTESFFSRTEDTEMVISGAGQSAAAECQFCPVYDGVLPWVGHSVAEFVYMSAAYCVILCIFRLVCIYLLNHLCTN